MIVHYHLKSLSFKTLEVVITYNLFPISPKFQAPIFLVCSSFSVFIIEGNIPPNSLPIHPNFPSFNSVSFPAKQAPQVAESFHQEVQKNPGPILMKPKILEGYPHSTLAPFPMQNSFSSFYPPHTSSFFPSSPIPIFPFSSVPSPSFPQCQIPQMSF